MICSVIQKSETKYGFLFMDGETITEMNIKNELPLRVKFQTYEDNYETNFTIDGRHNLQTVQVLFWQEYKIQEKAFQKPLPNLKIDTKVLVWDN